MAAGVLTGGRAKLILTFLPGRRRRVRLFLSPRNLKAGEGGSCHGAEAAWQRSHHRQMMDMCEKALTSMWGSVAQPPLPLPLSPSPPYSV